MSAPHDGPALTCPAPALAWRDGEPFSNDFNDIYFSRAGGLAESRHVFLNGIEIDPLIHCQPCLVLGETGFGTGLNFLATMQHFLKVAPHRHRLVYLSVEKYPLRQPDLARALQAFPELAPLTRALLAGYPAPAPGFHPLPFAGGRVQLILGFGEAEAMLAAADASVHGWYLDGFAPARNAALWTPGLIEQIARLSAPDARVATFSAARAVREALTAAGFTVSKQPGFGHKRNRLTARLAQRAPTAAAPRWWHPPALAAPYAQPAAGARAAVIGAGIAGLSVAAALAARGRAVTVFDAVGLYPAASRVPAAILAPRFQRDSGSPVSAFMTSAFCRAVGDPRLRAILGDAPGLEVLPRSEDEQERHRRLLAECQWGDCWLHAAASGAIFFPKSGSFEPWRWLEWLASGLEVRGTAVSRIRREASRWRLFGADGQSLDLFQDVILAAGAHAAPAGMPAGPIRPQWGRVARYRAAAPIAGLGHAVAGGGYISRMLGGSDQVIVGAENARAPFMLQPAGAALATGIIHRLPEPWQSRLCDQPGAGEWQGVRANTADHLPLVGPLLDPDQIAGRYAALARDATQHPDIPPPLLPGLWQLGGLGSKGFQYAPLAADILAAMITGDPVPAPRALLAALHPARFAIRALIRSPASGGENTAG